MSESSDVGEQAARTRETTRAWDHAAAKYAPDLERDVAALRDGKLGIEPPQLAPLRQVLAAGARVIHLQCSHGQDALSLWRLGAGEVVGIDVSGAMLALAREKAARLGAPARFIEADVLAPPPELDGWADLDYTGMGSLPWVGDIEAWAAVAARLLRPGGRLFVYEGHPLNWVWEPEAQTFVPRAGRGYFDRGARPNDDFPARAVERHTPAGDVVPTAWEYQWTLGDVVNAVIGAGLTLERLDELPEHFWPQFRHVPDALHARLPHTFLLVARR
jgi:SAM-dependent methyltransferase